MGQRSDDEPRNPQAQVDLQVKTMAASECDEEVRAAWRERAVGNRPKRLVSVDECGSNVGLAPLHARAPKGKRARDKNTRRFWRAWGPQGGGHPYVLRGQLL